VLEGVLHLGPRHVDREADTIVRELLDLGLHPAIVPNAFRLGAGVGPPGRRGTSLRFSF
jgi:hypothetical protein